MSGQSSKGCTTPQLSYPLHGAFAVEVRCGSAGTTLTDTEVPLPFYAVGNHSSGCVFSCRMLLLPP